MKQDQRQNLNVYFCMFLVLLSSGITQPLGPYLLRELNISYTVFGSIFSFVVVIGALAYSILLLYPKPFILLILGLLFRSISYFVYASAITWMEILIGMLLATIGFSILEIASVAFIVAKASSKAFTVSILVSINSLAIPLGAAISPIYFSALNSNLRYSYLVASFIPLLGLIPVFALCKTNPEPLITKEKPALGELLNFLKYVLSQRKIFYTLLLIILGPFIWSLISPFTGLMGVYEANFALITIAGFISIHSAITTFLGPVFAKISDVIKKRSLLLGIAELIGSIYAAILLYSIAIKSPLLYFIASIFAGLSAAASAGIGAALIAELKPGEEARTLSLFQTVSELSAASGVFLGGFIFGLGGLYIAQLAIPAFIFVYGLMLLILLPKFTGK